MSETNTEKKQQVDVDLVVIGAGIQGAGVAQAASASGYRVAVLEQYAEPAQGTSSRSSKLIHGGLRYLETGQFSLVRECLLERSRLLKNAPHLVRLVPFYIPIYNDSHYGATKIMAGLSLYSLFSLKPFKLIPEEDWPSLSGLQTEGLKAVFQYYDAQTNDAELTKAVLSSASTLGTKVHYNAHFQTAEISDEACTVKYNQHGKDKTLSCYAVVNATGPWVKKIIEKIPNCQPQPEVDLVQGTHIEVPDPNSSIETDTSNTSPDDIKKGIYYLEAPQDKRAVFVMPWKKRLLIGTTETQYLGDPADVTPLESEINYLLEVYNHYFENKLNRSDVISSFAGLRVLPIGEGTAFSRPRDTLIVGNIAEQARLVTLYGGKLTAYRATAEQVMEKLDSVLPKPPNPSTSIDTKTLALPEFALQEHNVPG